MRYAIFIPIMLMATAAQASPPLPTEAQFSQMSCTQAIKATMRVIWRSAPEWHWMTQDQLATQAIEALSAGTQYFPDDPCRESHAAAPDSAPSVPTRAGKAGR